MLWISFSGTFIACRSIQGYFALSTGYQQLYKRTVLITMYTLPTGFKRSEKL